MTFMVLLIRQQMSYSLNFERESSVSISGDTGNCYMGNTGRIYMTDLYIGNPVRF